MAEPLGRWERVRSWRWSAGRRDPLPALLAAAAAVVYLLHGFDSALTRDLGVYAYAGVTVADGVPPYAGIFNRAGPLAHALPAVGVLGARLVGADELLGMRVLYLLFTVAAVAVAYLLVRDVFGSRLGGAAAAVALTALPPVIHLASGGPREKTPMLLLMLLALWALVHRRWFLAGVLVAAATLVLQVAFFPLVAAAVVAAAGKGDRGSRARALAAVGAGGLLSLTATVAFFAGIGRLRLFVDGFVLVNARYTTPNPALDHLATVWASLREGYGALLPVLLGGLVLLPVVALVLARAPRGRAPQPVVLVAMTAGVVTGLLWCLRDYDSYPDTFTLLPFVLVGVGGAVSLLDRGVGRRAALVTTLACTVAALVLGTTYAVTQRDDQLQVQRASVAAALRVLPGARITSIAAPEALVLAGQRNPSRHQMTSSGLRDYIDATWPGGFPGFVRWTRDRPSELVAVEPKLTDRWVDRLAPRYRRVGRAPDIRWFVATSVAPALRRELHQALGSVRQGSGAAE